MILGGGFLVCPKRFLLEILLESYSSAGLVWFVKKYKIVSWDINCVCFVKAYWARLVLRSVFFVVVERGVERVSRGKLITFWKICKYPFLGKRLGRMKSCWMREDE